VPQLSVDLRGKQIPLAYPADFVHDTVRLEPRVTVAATGLVFAGYGITAPRYGWDDYAGTDVHGKLVIVLSGEPESADPTSFRGATRTYFSTRESKYETARRLGAAGILVVTDPEKSQSYSIFRTFARLEGKALPPARGEPTLALAGLLTEKAMRRICESAGADFDTLQREAALPGFRAQALGGSAQIDIENRLRTFDSANVVGRLEGRDRAAEAVIFTAHWDHLGRDPSLAGDSIYNGANDNALGVAQLLEIARAFAALQERPQRSLLFVATTGEESGFLGAKYYVAHPRVPLDRTVAAFNLDAGNPFGLTRDLGSAGYGNSTLDEVLAEAARLQGRRFIPESLDGNGSYYFASDQAAFALGGVPAAFPWSGSDYVGKPEDFADQAWGEYGERRYHQVADEVMKDWDLTGAVEDARWLVIAGFLAADAAALPAWKPGVEFSRTVEP
jgi:Zn-dependent M28 family amino/carboxypeptidase